MIEFLFGLVVGSHLEPSAARSQTAPPCVEVESKADVRAKTLCGSIGLALMGFAIWMLFPADVLYMELTIDMGMGGAMPAGRLFNAVVVLWCLSALGFAELGIDSWLERSEGRTEGGFDGQ